MHSAAKQQCECKLVGIISPRDGNNFLSFLQCQMYHITYPQVDDGSGSVLFTSIDVINETNNLGGPKKYLLVAKRE